MPIESPYEILNLPVNASLESVKRQYKLLIRQYPPEQNAEMFNKIRAAYDQINTELFKKNASLPLYKKALGTRQTGENTPSVGQHTLLTLVFETPFNTPFELEKLLDSVEI
jgi:DnaJ-class molecular chaperone